MKARPYILEETNYRTVDQTRYDLAILPWGATEAHNYHLPYGTDTLEATHFAAEAARLAWEKHTHSLVLPTIPFGVNTTQMDIRFTINLNPSTQMQILANIVESLEMQGIQKLVVMNSHGGNDFKQMIRELVRETGIFMCTVNCYQVVNMADYFTDPGDHAGQAETGLIMHLAPELMLPLAEAGEGFARPFKIRALKERWAWAPREWMKVTEDTGVGNPAGVTVEEGQLFFSAVTAKIAEFLVELGEADIDDLYEQREQ